MGKAKRQKRARERKVGGTHFSLLASPVLNSPVPNPPHKAPIRRLQNRNQPDPAIGFATDAPGNHKNVAFENSV